MSFFSEQSEFSTQSNYSISNSSSIFKWIYKSKFSQTISY